jgi:hypothetical protein
LRQSKNRQSSNSEKVLGSLDKAGEVYYEDDTKQPAGNLGRPGKPDQLAAEPTRRGLRGLDQDLTGALPAGLVKIALEQAEHESKGDFQRRR